MQPVINMRRVAWYVRRRSRALFGERVGFRRANFRSDTTTS
jgi:hypothetical protein